MYGNAAGFLFLILWIASPLTLAWGATMCPDAIAGAMGLVALHSFRQSLRNASWTFRALAGVSLGMLLLTKLTWVIGLALWPLIWCIWSASTLLRKSDNVPRPPLGQLLTVLVIAIYVLNMGYMFNGTFRSLDNYTFSSRMFRGERTLPSDNLVSRTCLGQMPLPFPADYVQGMDTQRYDFERGMLSYLRGDWADHGWWYYYLYALAIKEPLGTWCLLAFAIGATAFGYGYSALWRDELIVLLPAVAILVFISSQTGFSVHSRYVVPSLPFIFVWISKVGRALATPPSTKRHTWMALSVIVAIAWSVGSSMAVYPHSLSYVNELAGLLRTRADSPYSDLAASGKQRTLWTVICPAPHHGPRHLLGSNIDWGQDLFYFEEWCRSHPEARPIRVAYSGSYPLSRTNVRSAGDPPVLEARGNADTHTTVKYGPLPGWHALSVNCIYGKDSRYAYFLRFIPVTTAGYSIYVYHITIDEANRVRKELGLSELSGSDR